METPKIKTFSPELRKNFRKYSSIIQQTKTLNSLYIENIKTTKTNKNLHKTKQSFNREKYISDFSIENEIQSENNVSNLLIDTSLSNNDNSFTKPFDTLTNERLQKMKENMLFFLKNTEEKLEIKYNNYIDYINGYIFQRELKISKILEDNKKNGNEEQKEENNIFQNNDKNEENQNEDEKENSEDELKINGKKQSTKNFANYVDKNIFKQIEYIFEIHKNIRSVIEDQVELLFDFLDEFELIFQRNPLETFIDQNGEKIMKSWLFSKIDFEKLNLSKLISNTELSEIFKKYLCKQSENKFCSINIGKKGKENFPVEKEFLQDNFHILQKIKFFRLQSEDFEQLFKDKAKNKTADKLKSIYISECNNLKKPDFLKFNYPSLEKLTINMSLLNFNLLSNPAMEKLQALKVIKINKCQLNDKNLNDFFIFLSQKKNLQKTLTNLTFTNNNLTYINMKNIIMQDGYFPNLTELNFSKNNIYDFLIDNFRILPALQLLNLSNNNISSFLLFNSIQERKKELKALVLFTNNLFITNNAENNQVYKKYFIELIGKCQYDIKSLPMILMYNKYNCDTLQNVILSSASKISLQKINLSYCGLSAKSLISFLKTNFGLLSLKELNISNNFIDNSFFTEYISINNRNNEEENDQVNIIKLLRSSIINDSEESFLLEQLEKIDLSNNMFSLKNFADFDNFSNFILAHSKIKIIKIQNNPFENDFYNLWSEKINNDEINKNGNRKSINNNLKTFAAKKIKIFFREMYGINIDPELLDVINFKDKSI